MHFLNKAKVGLLIGIPLLILFGIVGISLARTNAAHRTIHPAAISRSTPNATQQISTRTSKSLSAQLAKQPTPTPTAKATATAVPTPPRSTQSPSQGTTSAGSTIRYFPVGTPVAKMQADATAMSKQQVKLLLEREVNANLGVIETKLGFSSEQQAYAFFLGMATRESTLNAGLETGSGPSHSYGPIQAAEPAYAGNPNYAQENDVPQMTQFSFTPQNFYDPGIAVYMGIRHLLHFCNQARAAGYTGTDMLRHALAGYNTGNVNVTDQNELQSYADEIGSLAGWYLDNAHLYDTLFTWTGDPRVNRSQPWGWY